MSYCEPMKNYFLNHYGFILGFVAGMGFFLFCIEASKPIKNPGLYLGGLGLSIAGSIIYRKLKKDAAHSLDSAKGNSEAKAK